MIYELHQGIVHLTSVNDKIYFKPSLVKAKMVPGQKSLLIMKADYCGYCQRLLATLQSPVFENYVIFTFDQSDSSNKKVMQALGVNSYPTIYPVSADGEIEVDEEYTGERDIQSLLEVFI